MLLVDDHESEARKKHVLAEQRVCADDDIGKAHLEFPENHFALRSGGGAHEQAYIQARRIEERLEALVVLPREDIRRNHQRALLAHPITGGAV